jgi:hypothetical protein
MSDVNVKRVIAILSNPSRHDDLGRVTIGFYTLKDGLLTMTDGDGAPVRSRGGDKFVHKLQPNENPDAIAKRLTVKIHRMAQGDGHNIWRKIDWPRNGNIV